MRTITEIAACAFLVVLMTMNEAHAYLDPGTGSMLLQGLLGGIAAGYLVLKLWWHKLKALVSRGEIRKRADGQAADSTTPRIQ